jgi:hypothetical protein
MIVNRGKRQRKIEEDRETRLEADNVYLVFLGE